MKYISKYKDFLITEEWSKNDAIPELNTKSKLGIILLGPPGVGKSTFVKNFILPRNQNIKTFSTDDVSLMFTKNPNVYHKGSSELNINRLKKFMESGQSFIYDTTGTQEENVRNIHNAAKFNGYTTIFIHVIAPLDTSIRQNISRERQVSQDYIKIAYDRQFGNISRYSNELHPDAYYIVQNKEGRYKFSKYDSGKILKRKVDKYLVESEKEELDVEMIRFILDDIIDDFGRENVFLYSFENKTFYVDDFSNPEKVSKFKISQEIYNTKSYRFKVVVDLKGSEYSKFTKLINDFNSCIERFKGYEWKLFRLDVDCESVNRSANLGSSFRRTIFTMVKDEEAIRNKEFNEDEMADLIEKAFDEHGLVVTDYEFSRNENDEPDCEVSFDSKAYGGEMPDNMGDVMDGIVDRIGASDSRLHNQTSAYFEWANWPEH